MVMCKSMCGVGMQKGSTQGKGQTRSGLAPLGTTVSLEPSLGLKLC